MNGNAIHKISVLVKQQNDLGLLLRGFLDNTTLLKGIIAIPHGFQLLIKIGTELKKIKKNG